MALSTYSDLVASIGTWMDGADLSSSEADLVALAEDEINNRLSAKIVDGARIRPMMQSDSITLDGEYVALPDGRTILPITLEVSGLDRPWQVDYIDLDSLVRLRFGQAEEREAVSGLIGSNPPRFYSMVGDQLRLFPAPETMFTATLIRYIKVPALSDSVTSNWLLASHPTAYLYGALAQAELLGWNDARVANLATLFADSVDSIAARYPAPSNRAPLRSDVAMIGTGYSYANFMSGI